MLLLLDGAKSDPTKAHANLVSPGQDTEDEAPNTACSSCFSGTHTKVIFARPALSKQAATSSRSASVRLQMFKELNAKQKVNKEQGGNASSSQLLL